MHVFVQDQKIRNTRVAERYVKNIPKFLISNISKANHRLLIPTSSKCLERYSGLLFLVYSYFTSRNIICVVHSPSLKII